MNNFENKSDTKIFPLSCKIFKYIKKKNLRLEADFFDPLLSQRDICSKFV